MQMVVHVYVFSIGLLGFVDTAQDCLVYDVGGDDAAPRSPPITLNHHVTIGIFKGHHRGKNSRFVVTTNRSSGGSVEFEVYLEAGGKTFVLMFNRGEMRLLQESARSSEMGRANIPLRDTPGRWQYVGVMVSGGWVMVMSPERGEEAVFQMQLGVDTARCQLSLSSTSRLAITYNCMPGCPVVVRSGSVVSDDLPLVRSRSLYLSPDAAQYTAIFKVEVETEMAKDTLLLEVRRGLLRPQEWNRVDVNVEARHDEVEVWLEVNGEGRASDTLGGRLISSTLGVEELAYASLSTLCRPATPSHQETSEIQQAGSCSWNLVWTLVGITNLLLVLLAGSCCALYRKSSGQSGISAESVGLAVRGSTGILRTNREMARSYHHYEEVDTLRGNSRGPPSVVEDTKKSTNPPEHKASPLAKPLENIAEEDLDLGSGYCLMSARIYQNDPLNS
ncbi:uncharacterized protein LOC121878129 isoform X2 [Homarus americanus]|uniref:uncharacterized protein LOC121878129 isoform X2 n=1 Tax=Homarus americanus TaxID=6706 RepID=UPI001C44A5A0|nr:uncharacterized protein LOC121878129 isoform X2 [Homarus americanus]